MKCFGLFAIALLAVALFAVALFAVALFAVALFAVALFAQLTQVIQERNTEMSLESGNPSLQGLLN